MFSLAVKTPVRTSDIHVRVLAFGSQLCLPNVSGPRELRRNALSLSLANTCTYMCIRMYKPLLALTCASVY